MLLDCARGLVVVTMLCLLGRGARADAPLQLEVRPDVVFVAPPRLPPAVDARERALRLHLTELGLHGDARIVRGVLQLAVGGAIVTAGVLLDQRASIALLGMLGGASVTRGVLELVRVPDPRKVADAYASLPMANAEQVRARIAFGEGALAKLARAGRRTRILDGFITMAVSSSYVPLWWGLARREDPDHRFGQSAVDFVALALSVVNFGSGLFNALSKSEAERRLAAYQGLNARLETEAPGPLGRLSGRSRRWDLRGNSASSSRDARPARPAFGAGFVF